MSDSVSREIISLLLMAITLSLTAAPLNFNFFLLVLGSTISGLLYFGVDVLQGVTALISAFIAPDAIIILVESNSIDSISSALSDKDSTIVMSAETSLNDLKLSYHFRFCEDDLK